MRIINPTWSAIHQSTNPLLARAKTRRWLKNGEKGALYLAGKHKFEMYHNAVPTAEFRVMTGFEARTLNSKYRQDFIEEVERVYPAYVEVPLKHWTVVERFTEDNPGAAQ